MEIIDSSSGACLSVGRPAAFLYNLCKQMLQMWGELGATPVWLPSMHKSQISHPMSVGSEHCSGCLTHAACLSLLDSLNSAEPLIFGGFGVVHRQEPLRNLDPRIRLEAFTVAETVIVGDSKYCSEMYSVVKKIQTEVVRAYVPNCTWEYAKDAFATGIRGKEELIVRRGGLRVALGSANDHGNFFLSRRKILGESRCFGIGLERLQWAVEESEEIIQ